MTTKLDKNIELWLNVVSWAYKNNMNPQFSIINNASHQRMTCEGIVLEWWFEYVEYQPFGTYISRYPKVTKIELWNPHDRNFN